MQYCNYNDITLLIIIIIVKVSFNSAAVLHLNFRFMLRNAACNFLKFAYKRFLLTVPNTHLIVLQCLIKDISH